MTKASKEPWRRAEKLFLIVGIIMLSAYAITRAHSLISSWLALRNFERSYATASSGAGITAKSHRHEAVDFSVWSPKRIQAYQESLTIKVDRPLAILRIRKLRIEVPVFDGTDDLTLNRGVGRIVETAKIGESGNIGIAGHRDGFFRGLKDIAAGEDLELVTPDKTIRYVVERIEIVQPEDVSVLTNRGVPSLTLVTCYPFYFVGDAPQRFIVHAKSMDLDGSVNLPGASSNQIKSNQRRK
jgi:sortase A